MCIRVQYTPRDQLGELWDVGRRVITLPSELRDEFVLRALRAVLQQLGVPQAESGARCWCGEPIGLLPAIPQQRRSDEVIHSGA